MASIEFDPIQTLDTFFDISGNQRRADQQIAQQNQYNARANFLDEQKFHHSRLQYAESKARYRRQMERDDNKLQRLVKDANAAGISISTALGAPGSTPISAQIPGMPGHGTRVAGNAKQIDTSGLLKAQVQMGVAKSAQELEAFSYDINRKRFDSDFAFYRMLQEKAKWEASRNPEQPQLPNRYDLYRNNYDEAVEHVNKGGWAIPAGASMEMPETIGGYYFMKPYGDSTITHDIPNFFNNNSGGFFDRFFP